MKSFKILNSKKIQLLILMSLVLTLTLGVYIYRGKEVVLEVDGSKTNAVSYSKTIEELIQKEEVDFQEGAYINLPLDTQIENNIKIIIINPKTYNIKDKGKSAKVKSVHDLTGRVLKDQKIELGALDYTVPALGTKLEEGATIEIFRVKEEVVVSKSDIVFTRKKVDTNSLYKGTEKIKQKGSSGVLATHTKNRYVNGKLEKSEVVKKEVTKKMKEHIILVGTKNKPVVKPVAKAVAKVEPKVKTATRGSSRKTVVKQTAQAPKKTSKKPSRGSSSRNGTTIVMSASAYTDNKSSQGKWVGKTASGMKPQYGVVAVDPSVIPLGTRLYIEGYGNAIAGDTGGAIKGNRIDLFYNTRSEALSFGRRTIKVTILK
nr:3D domain-containing protein [Tissierella sp.]